MNPSFIRLHPADDVVIARAQLMTGTTVDGVAVRGLVPPGHKVATRTITQGEPVRRYNQIIGFASQTIAPGEHVHTHNLNMGPDKGSFERDYAFGADIKPDAPAQHGTFMGYVRPDLATVGQKLKVRMNRELWDVTVVEDSPFDPKNARIRVDG